MTFPGSVYDFTDSIPSTATVQTTDATITTAWSMPVPAGMNVDIKWTVLGAKSDGTQFAQYEGTLRVTYPVGGSCAARTLTSGTDATPYYESDTLWGGITADVSSNTARIRVTGKAATTINWRVVCQTVAQ